MKTVSEIRSGFPILSRKVYGKDLVYLDNAATAQKPQQVIDKLIEINNLYTANAHRAVHYLSGKATEAYEGARDAVTAYIGAGSREEVIFTSGTTASINLVAFSFGEAFIHEGDEIIVTEAEHHSNIVPWQMLCERKKAVLKVWRPEDDGFLPMGALARLITDKTRLVAVTHISNVLGVVNPVKDIVAFCHSWGVPVLIDGAQGIVHERVDMQALDCDFYAFSGHKIYAATGTGVLYGKKKWLDAMPPYMGGGEMIGTVRFEGTTYAPLPGKFEAGTQNLSGVPTLVPAMEILREMQESQAVMEEQSRIKDYLMDWFAGRGDIRLFGVPRRTSDKINLYSFAVEGAHHEDLALILDKMGIAVRSGQMCAEPLMDRFGVTGMLRASFAPYNTLAEAEYLTKCLDKAINMVR
ncbi:MAG: SufS family cysteine desulfurase [Bacteroidales bacterium]|nr:SufS family cysteine desulfurase [Bacteroidales bacterium]